MRAPGPRAPLVAMILGAALALGGVALGGESELGELEHGAVARVDGVAISRSDYERALAALAADLRRPIGDEDRAHVVERLVDEVLLVEHGLALGLPRRDPYLRTQVARAVLDRVSARVETEAAGPTAAQLRAHYDARPERYSPTARVELAGLFVAAGPGAEDRAAALAQRWRGGEAFAVLEAEADAPALALPHRALPPNKLRDYLGATATAAALALAPGAVSEPIVSTGGVWILKVLTSEPGELRSFEQVRERVAADLLRTREDEAVAALLAELREQATIEIAWDGL